MAQLRHGRVSLELHEIASALEGAHVADGVELLVSTSRDILAAAEAGRQIRTSNRKESDEAVEKMKKNGLVVHQVTPGVTPRTNARPPLHSTQRWCTTSRPT